MIALEFEEQNLVFAENQEEYENLPAHVDSKEGSCAFRFKLNEEELKQVKETGEIWLKVLNFNKPLQPIGMSLLKPKFK